jgi:DNA-binding response OmpR family regulator
MAAEREVEPGSPGVILAHRDPGYVAQTCRALRQRGWRVHLARSGEEVRRLAHRLAPAAVALDTELADESGWLTCAKLTGEQPQLKVILVGPHTDRTDRRFAAFAGAAGLVSPQDGVPALVEEVCGGPLPVAV